MQDRVLRLDSLSGVLPNKGSRIKYLCLDVCSRYLAIGANTGSVYVFDTRTFAIVKIVNVDNNNDPRTQDAVTKVKFNPRHASLITFGTSAGLILIVNTKLTSLTSKEIEKTAVLARVTNHLGHQISCLLWDEKGARLFSADDAGQVLCTSFTSKGRRRRGSLLEHLFQSTIETSVVAKLENRIVQLDLQRDSNVLLASTMQKSAVIDLEKHTAWQVGKKMRNGYYGACFDPNSNGRQILSARKGKRLWVADPKSGQVHTTLKFQVSSPPQIFQPFSVNAPDGEVVPDELIKESGFGILTPFCQSLISWGGRALLIVDPTDVTVKEWHLKLGWISDLSVFGETFFILHDTTWFDEDNKKVELNLQVSRIRALGPYHLAHTYVADGEPLFALNLALEKNIDDVELLKAIDDALKNDPKASQELQDDDLMTEKYHALMQAAEKKAAEKKDNDPPALPVSPPVIAPVDDEDFQPAEESVRVSAVASNGESEDDQQVSKKSSDGDKSDSDKSGRLAKMKSVAKSTLEKSRRMIKTVQENKDPKDLTMTRPVTRTISADSVIPQKSAISPTSMERQRSSPPITLENPAESPLRSSSSPKTESSSSKPITPPETVTALKPPDSLLPRPSIVSGLVSQENVGKPPLSPGTPRTPKTPRSDEDPATTNLSPSTITSSAAGPTGTWVNASALDDGKKKRRRRKKKKRPKSKPISLSKKTSKDFVPSSSRKKRTDSVESPSTSSRVAAEDLESESDAPSEISDQKTGSPDIPSPPIKDIPPLNRERSKTDPNVPFDPQVTFYAFNLLVIEERDHKCKNGVFQDDYEPDLDLRDAIINWAMDFNENCDRTKMVMSYNGKTMKHVLTKLGICHMFLQIRGDSKWGPAKCLTYVGQYIRFFDVSMVFRFFNEIEFPCFAELHLLKEQKLDGNSFYSGEIDPMIQSGDLRGALRQIASFNDPLLTNRYIAKFLEYLPSETCNLAAESYPGVLPWVVKEKLVGEKLPDDERRKNFQLYATYYDNLMHNHKSCWTIRKYVCEWVAVILKQGAPEYDKLFTNVDSLDAPIPARNAHTLLWDFEDSLKKITLENPEAFNYDKRWLLDQYLKAGYFIGALILLVRLEDIGKCIDISICTDDYNTLRDVMAKYSTPEHWAHIFTKLGELGRSDESPDGTEYLITPSSVVLLMMRYLGPQACVNILSTIPSSALELVSEFYKHFLVADEKRRHQKEIASTICETIDRHLIQQHQSKAMEAGRNGDQFAQLSHLIQVPAENKLYTEFNSHTSPSIQTNFQLLFGHIEPPKHTNYEEDQRFEKTTVSKDDSKTDEVTCICCNLPISETFKRENSLKVTNNLYGSGSVTFSCGHSFHEICLPEQACLICFANNFKIEKPNAWLVDYPKL